MVIPPWNARFPRKPTGCRIIIVFVRRRPCVGTTRFTYEINNCQTATTLDALKTYFCLSCAGFCATVCVALCTHREISVNLYSFNVVSAVVWMTQLRGRHSETLVLFFQTHLVKFKEENVSNDVFGLFQFGCTPTWELTRIKSPYRS